MRYRNIILFVILFLSALSLKAQEDMGVGFSSWLKEPISELNEANNKSLQVKINQIIARNGAGATSALSTMFVIYPEFIITRSDVVNSGIKPITVVRGELSLFAVNRADMSNYGSVVVALQGNGNSEQECIRSMISKVQPTNPAFSKFIKKARENIIDYYATQTPILRSKAQSLFNRGMYNDAIALLSLIPECVPEYPSIASEMTNIYMKMQDKVAATLLTDAKAKMNLKDYKGAMEVLAKVDASCNLAPKAFTMMDDIKLQLDEQQKREMDLELKRIEAKKEEAIRARDDINERRRLQQEASKNAADYELSNRISNSGFEGLKKWLLGDLK